MTSVTSASAPFSPPSARMPARANGAIRKSRREAAPHMLKPAPPSDILDSECFMWHGSFPASRLLHFICHLVVVHLVCSRLLLLAFRFARHLIGGLGHLVVHFVHLVLSESRRQRQRRERKTHCDDSLHMIISLFGCWLKSGVPVVTALGPVVGRTGRAERDGPDTLQVLDPVLDGREQAQRRPMLRRERRAVHFVAQQSLGMQRGRHVKSDVIFLS